MTTLSRATGSPRRSALHRRDLEVVELVVDRAGGVGDRQLAIADVDGLGPFDEMIAAGRRAAGDEDALGVELVDAVDEGRVAGDEADLVHAVGDGDFPG